MSTLLVSWFSSTSDEILFVKHLRSLRDHHSLDEGSLDEKFSVYNQQDVHVFIMLL